MSRDERQHVIIFLRQLKYRYKGSLRSRFVPRDYRVIRRKDERDCFIRRELTVRKYPAAAAKTVLERAHYILSFIPRYTFIWRLRAG